MSIVIVPFEAKLINSATGTVALQSDLENKPRLQLEHARRIDVGECRYGVGRRRVGERSGQHPKVRARSRRVQTARDSRIDRLSPTQHVRVIEEIEAFQAEHDALALRQANATFDEGRDIRGRSAPEE